MGYTHYFQGSGEGMINAECQAELRELLEEGFQKGVIALEKDAPTEKPLVNERIVRFNGVGEGGHEGFFFDITNAETEFAFCRTARKPYDEYVTKTLLLLKHHHPNVELSSDGRMDGEEWKAARDWMQSIGKA